MIQTANPKRNVLDKQPHPIIPYRIRIGYPSCAATPSILYFIFFPRSQKDRRNRRQTLKIIKKKLDLPNPLPLREAYFSKFLPNLRRQNSPVSAPEENLQNYQASS